ncbi:tyrosine-type recombinase/integrase [Pseudomonas sp. WC1]|uniref:tyrosine-type recombinase/integrase n=1 Tax=Pseudomonas sp. WC1 TaxID=3424772 RepID=UPI003D32DCFB
MKRNSPPSIGSLPTNFNLPYIIKNDGRPIYKPASELPIVRFPDGKICFMANLFCLELYSKGYSLLNGGGSIRTYLTQLYPLIRYTHLNQIHFLEISNNRFQQFMLSLNTVNQHGDPIRSSNQKISIIFQSLDFLQFVGETCGRPNFVSENGTIRAEMVREKSIDQNEDSYATGPRWKIDNLPLPDVKGPGLAIGKEALRAIKHQTSEATSSFLSSRNSLIVDFLEETGARRGEMTPQTVQSIYDAIQNKLTPNALSIKTIKQGREDITRDIPVSSALLTTAREHIEMSRRRIIRRTLGAKDDHGYLFISERTGLPLSTNYITNIFHKLRKDSGITEKAHPHQLRHLFAQREHQLLELIMENNVDFKIQGYAKKNEAITLKLMQLLGHRSRKSPDHYIEQSNAELAKIALTDKILIREQAIESYLEKTHSLIEASSSMSAKEFRQHCITMLKSIVKDIDSE